VIFQQKTLQARREWQDIFKVLKENNLQEKNTQSSKAIIQNRRRNKEFLRQTKTKGAHDH